LFDIFGTGDQQAAANSQIAGINAGLGGLTGDINSGNQALQTNYSNALAPFTQNYNTATQGTTALGNALGLNGAQGSQNATQSFMNNPAYAFALKQGQNGITAADAASGKTGSGNEALALSNYGQGQAAQGWNSYLQNLQPYLGASGTAAAGIGGVDTGLGNQLNANYNTLGNATYGANTSIGNANANANLAGLGASANMLGAASGIGSALLGFLSDERAKSDIKPVGKLFDGQNIYSYRYKGSDPRIQIGLLAQEVEDAHPDAVFDIGDLKGVNYDRATSFAADLGRFA
jgi:Chaperone of endosialidase